MLFSMSFSQSNGRKLDGNLGEGYQKKCMEGAFEGAMAAAVRDYIKLELGGQENQNVDESELMDDPEIVAIQKARLEKLKKEREEALERKAKGHGEYREIEESEFIDQLNSSDHVVVHFYHPDFTRCKIVDKHLAMIARKYMVTKFIKLNVDKSPFFVAKLVVKTLPCVIIFKKAVAVDRIVGFEEVGGVDDFPQYMLERRLAKNAGLVYKPDIDSEDEDEEEAAHAKAAKGSIYGFTAEDNDDADW